MSTRPFRYLSVCSGIEAASVAWHPLGWEPLAFAEIEPFPRAVLAHHYPDVPCHGDFTKLRDENWIWQADVLVGGTPCQAFSVVGPRKSLDDARGNLTLEFVRLADAIDHLRHARGLPPVIVVWENVPGVFSTKDNAFGCFLGALVGEDAAIDVPRGKWTNAGVAAGPQRRAAWRVLDAQYFGLAQRRRRVFVVAGAGDGFDPAAVLFEPEGVQRDTAPRREARETVTHDIAPSFRARGNASHRLDSDIRVADSLTVGANQTFGLPGEAVVAKTLMAKHQRLDPEVESFVIAYGADGTVEGPVPPVMARSSRGGAQTLSPGHQTDGHMVCVTGPVTHALKAEGFDASEDGTGRGNPIVPVAVAFAIQAGALRTNPASGPDGVGIQADHAYTIEARAEVQAVAASMQVRRLTPRECEALQGFPPDYTLIPWRNKPAADCPDGPRYKALGNSMAVPCMRFIGQRIALQIPRETLP